MELSLAQCIYVWWKWNEWDQEHGWKSFAEMLDVSTCNFFIIMCGVRKVLYIQWRSYIQTKLATASLFSIFFQARSLSLRKINTPYNFSELRIENIACNNPLAIMNHCLKREWYQDEKGQWHFSFSISYRQHLRRVWYNYHMNRHLQRLIYMLLICENTKKYFYCAVSLCSSLTL